MDFEWNRFESIIKRYRQKVSPLAFENISRLKHQLFEDIGISPEDYKEATLYHDISEDTHNSVFCQGLDEITDSNITEIVNLKSLKKYAYDRFTPTKKSLVHGNHLIFRNSLIRYIRYLEENGVDYNGYKKHEVRYYRKNGIGRRYALGPSMQFMGREVRKVAFENISFDIDMVNACWSILFSEIRDEHIAYKYPLISMYASNPLIWKMIMSEYYDETIEESKIRLLQPLYGLLPSDDNPFLWKINLEVINAAKYLLSLEKNKIFRTMFQYRKIPIFSRLVTMILIKEDALLSKLETMLLNEFPDANISLLQYDGLQLFAGQELKQDLENVLENFQYVTGVTVIIKELLPNQLKTT